jgi:hypothetical protein
MTRWDDEGLLEVVEMVAENEAMISSEEELSENFDNMLEDINCCPERLTETDVNCMFNDWKDGEAKDGNIHQIQDNQYCYVGKYGE